MVNEYKISVMTKAAMYESSLQYRRDSFTKRYYKADYIALNRFITKVWVTFFFCLGLVAYAFLLVYVEKVDLLHFDYQGFAIKAAVIYLLISLAISLITSAVYGNRYTKAEKRMKAFFDKLDTIDRYQVPEKPAKSRVAAAMKSMKKKTLKGKPLKAEAKDHSEKGAENL